MNKIKYAPQIKTAGLLLLLWPFAFLLISMTLEVIFNCDVQMAGVIENVTCSRGGASMEDLIMWLGNSLPWAFFTIVPAIILIVISFASSSKKSAAPSDQNTLE